MAIGYKEYDRFKKGERLTRKQAILSQCYICNGESDGGVDCRGESCPLYSFMPYNPFKQVSKHKGNPENLKKRKEASRE